MPTRLFRLYSAIYYDTFNKEPFKRVLNNMDERGLYRNNKKSKDGMAVSVI